MIALGIDAGASSSRWLLLEGDRTDARMRARGRGAPITGHVFTPGDRDVTLERLATLCADVATYGSPAAVVAGITGLDRGSAAARVLATALAANLGLSAGHVRVMHDMDIAYHAAFAPGEGVLVYGGTGSIAYHVPADADAEAGVRVGGHGYLIDDAGGGFWIGRQALRAVLRAHDRLGARPDTPLADAVYAHIGSDDWGAVREHVYGEGRSAVAALAAVVGHAADLGDADALQILRAAGEELARLAAVMFERLGARRPVALGGGVVRLGEPLLSGFRHGLPWGVPVTPLDIEPVDVAARLAFAIAS